MDVLFSKCSDRTDLANLMTYLEIAKQYYKLKWDIDMDNFLNRKNPDEWHLKMKKMEMDRIEAIIMSKNEKRLETDSEIMARCKFEYIQSHLAN